jgi:hypothetical protein
MYKEGRYGLSTGKYLEQMHWTFWTLGMLHLCPVANTILAETKQDDLLSLPASHIRVMPDVRLDGKGHIISIQKEQRPCGHDRCNRKPRKF